MRGSYEARPRILLPHATPGRIVALLQIGCLSTPLGSQTTDTAAFNVIGWISASGNIVNSLLTILVEGSASLERHGMRYARLLATTHQGLTAG
jgi:hypothetical protein